FKKAGNNPSGTICLNDIIRNFDRLHKNSSAREEEFIKRISAAIADIHNNGNALLNKQCCIYHVFTSIKRALGNKIDRANILKRIIRTSTERVKELMRVSKSDKDAKEKTADTPKPS